MDTLGYQGRTAHQQENMQRTGLVSFVAFLIVAVVTAGIALLGTGAKILETLR